MLRWRDNPNFDPKSTSKIFNQVVIWIYSALIFGLFARLVEIKPSKITALGVEFNVSNADVIPGLFFFVVIALTFLLSFYLVMSNFFYKVNNKSNLRSLIYHAAVTSKKFGSKKITYYTLRGKKIKVVKTIARVIFRVYAAFALLVVFLPSIFVTCFESSAVIAAISRVLENAK